jgi:hypothetical protein
MLKARCANLLCRIITVSSVVDVLAAASRPVGPAQQNRRRICFGNVCATAGLVEVIFAKTFYYLI